MSQNNKDYIVKFYQETNFPHEKIEGNLLREKIVQLVQDNPSKAAQIVHEMIHSDNNNKEIA